MTIEYRLAEPTDEALLGQIHYLASFASAEASGKYIPPRQAAMTLPDFNRYFLAWGRPGDTGVVPGDTDTGMVVGAAWYREFTAEDRPGRPETGIVMPPHELSIGVAPDYQGQGIGTSLLKRLLGQARYEGVEAIGLGVADDNPRAKKLYESIGFVTVAHIADHTLMQIFLQNKTHA